jgi:thioredoxin 1
MTEKVRTTSGTAFKDDVSMAEGPVLVDFYADWCEPCKVLGPILEDVASDLDERLEVVKVNVDHDQGLSAQYGIRGIPTLILFKDGDPVETIVGLTTKSDLLEVINPHL